MNSTDSEKSKHAETVIRNHVFASMGAGIIPIMLADILAVTLVQTDMIKQLCRVYEVEYEATKGKAIVTALTTSTLARTGARSVVKLIPVIGTYIGGAAVAVFAGASTYAVGEVFKKHFETGGTFLDFDTERLKKYYKEKFEKGKKVAQEMKMEQDQKVSETEVEPTSHKDFTFETSPLGTDKPTPSPVETSTTINVNTRGTLAQLKELADLKAAGVITEEEFEIMKKKLIKEF